MERSGCRLSDECKYSITQDGCQFPLISRGKVPKHSAHFCVCEVNKCSYFIRKCLI